MAAVLPTRAKRTNKGLFCRAKAFIRNNNAADRLTACWFAIEKQENERKVRVPEYSFQVLFLFWRYQTHKNNRKQAWPQEHTSNTMGVILYLAPVPSAQIIHPDCDLRTVHPSQQFMRKQTRWPQIVSQVFVKNSLIKNIFEEERKRFIVEHDFVAKIVSYLVYLGQGEDFKLTTELT